MGHHGAICPSPRFWTKVGHVAAPIWHCGVTSVSGGRRVIQVRAGGVFRQCGQCSICALCYGASGIVLKETATRLLRKSIDTVMASQYWIEREGVSDSAHVLAKRPSVVSREDSNKSWRLTLVNV
jgi:hypothetical protein